MFRPIWSGLLAWVLLFGYASASSADLLAAAASGNANAKPTWEAARLAAVSGPCAVVYPTQNMYNDLLLDTATGYVWQVSWSTDANGLNGMIPLNDHALITEPPVDATDCGRFQLVSTQNIWTFIMVDRVSDATWHVQFSTDGPQYRFVERLLVLNKDGTPMLSH